MQNPVNVTTQPELMAFMVNAANQHVASITPGVSQYEGMDWGGCCRTGLA